MINLNAGEAAKGVDLCGELAIYAAWTENCSMCWLMDFPRCIGHPVCVRHGAELRAELLRDGPERAEIQRLSSLPQKPAEIMGAPVSRVGQREREGQ